MIEGIIKGYLLFIDLCTLANWSHDCLYVFISDKGEIIEQKAFCPPVEDIDLKKFC